jgi:hypothetical protein
MPKKIRDLHGGFDFPSNTHSVAINPKGRVPSALPVGIYKAFAVFGENGTIPSIVH